MNTRVLTTAVLLSLFILRSVAQNATIDSFAMTNDIIAGDDRRSDYNGTPCALVKIQVVDDINDIDGNVMGEINSHGVEKWVYMARGSRNMTIHLKNYLPVDVQFRKYNIRQLESNRVYKLILKTSAPAPIDITQVKGNYLQLKVNPKDAGIVVWGENMQKRLEYPNSDGLLKLYLPYGRYNYLVTADGYRDFENTVFVQDEGDVIGVNLEVIKGHLTVSCQTDKVDYFISGVKKEKGKKSKSWSGDLSPGQYIVEACRKGFVTQSKLVNVRADKSETVTLGALMSERDYKKLETSQGVPISEMDIRRDSIITARKNILLQIEDAKAKKEKADSMARAKMQANARDVIQMKDGSTIRCHVSDVRDMMVLIRQNAQQDVLRIPVRDIEYIEYINGEKESFNK